MPIHTESDSTAAIGRTVHTGVTRAAVATTLFVVGLLLNNVTLATSDYTAVIIVASMAFVATLAIVACSWRNQKTVVRVWFVLLVCGCVEQLFDAIARRMLHVF